MSNDTSVQEPVRGTCDVCERIIEEWETYYELDLDPILIMLVCANCIADSEKTGTQNDPEATR